MCNGVNVHGLIDGTGLLRSQFSVYFISHVCSDEVKKT